MCDRSKDRRRPSQRFVPVAKSFVRAILSTEVTVAKCTGNSKIFTSNAAGDTVASSDDLSFQESSSASAVAGLAD